MALNGDTLNINLKTGTEVSGSGLGCGAGSPRMSVCPCSAGCFLQLREAPAAHPAFSLAPFLLQWERCIEVVGQDKTTFPNLTDVSEVVTDQFLCSGMEKDDNPCKGEPPTTPHPRILAGRPQGPWPARGALPC